MSSAGTEDEAEPDLTNPDAARDVRLMMRHFGVDPEAAAEAAPAAVHKAERACARCPAVGRCHDWLAGDRAADVPGEFCPNTSTFEALTRLVPKAK